MKESGPESASSGAGWESEKGRLISEQFINLSNSEELRPDQKQILLKYSELLRTLLIEGRKETDEESETIVGPLIDLSNELRQEQRNIIFDYTDFNREQFYSEKKTGEGGALKGIDRNNKIGNLDTKSGLGKINNLGEKLK